MLAWGIELVAQSEAPWLPEEHGHNELALVRCVRHWREIRRHLSASLFPIAKLPSGGQRLGRDVHNEPPQLLLLLLLFTVSGDGISR
jgi:hypothetical protein